MINIAELLKDCPSGMELDCTMFENLEFDEIVNNSALPIRCRLKSPNGGGYNIYNFTKYGCWNTIAAAKCVIFPKGKTTWEGFQRPFKDGDILFYKHKSNNVKYTFIYKRRIDMRYLLQYCGWFLEKPYLSEQFNAKKRMPLYENDDIRFATEEEKQKLFKAIKDNGYKWNPETKTLEKLIKPKFKLGDKVRVKNGVSEPRIIDGVFDTFYSLQIFGKIDFTDQNNWELVPDKFDISKLKPFESKVLVRDNDHDNWKPSFWGFLREGEFMYDTVRGVFRQCIPYESNRHLMNTTDDCDKFFKTWEK